MMTDDMVLVREYAQSGSEEAFAALVSRHIHLVYSVAQRRVNDPHLAEEITQAVFIILAQKAHSLAAATVLPAWLCRTAHYVSARALTMQSRRQRREQEFYMESTVTEQESSTWTQIAPLLDDALQCLGEKDHSAIVLRFFEGKDMKQVGQALGTRENAARMRVHRALEKLRKFFSRRGVASTTSIISGAISSHAVQPAPATLAKTVLAAALAKGAVSGGSTLTLVKGALRIMAWTKLKTAAVTGAALLFVAGTTTVGVKQILYGGEDPVWRHITRLDSGQLEAAPPAVSVRPTKSRPGASEENVADSKNKMLSFATPVAGILGHAYNICRVRIINPELLPAGKYDYIVTVPDHQAEALQGAIKKKFKLVAKPEMHETNVLLLQVARPNAPGLNPASGRETTSGWGVGPGHIQFADLHMARLALYIELHLQIPVLDQTGLTGGYDFEMKWNGGRLSPDPDSLKQFLTDQLGLELTPATQSVEMMRLERVN